MKFPHGPAAVWWSLRQWATGLREGCRRRGSQVRIPAQSPADRRQRRPLRDSVQPKISGVLPGIRDFCASWQMLPGGLLFEKGSERMGIPRLMIAGTGSSCGKTTITCGPAAGSGHSWETPICLQMWAGLHRPHVPHRSHRRAPAGTWICSSWGKRESSGPFPLSGDLAVIEGVMGYYDGVGRALWQRLPPLSSDRYPAVLVLGV